jgi:hypothetical protein
MFTVIADGWTHEELEMIIMYVVGVNASMMALNLLLHTCRTARGTSGAGAKLKSTLARVRNNRRTHHG